MCRLASRFGPLGLVLGLLAALPWWVVWGRPPAAKPDVIVGDISDIRNWGSQGGLTGYSIATTSCNIGTARLDWLPDPDPRHPVIAQNAYRLSAAGRIEQIGLSWLKHGFAVAASNVCGNCQDSSSTHLAPNCSDLYGASLNGQQSNLGPRSEVNAATGRFRVPFTHLPDDQQNGPLPGHIQIRGSDINPALHPGASFLVEAEYVHPQDAAAGNGANNASTRPVFVEIVGGNPVLRLHAANPVSRMVPAIQAWASGGPGTVRLFNVDVPNDGRMMLGVRTIPAAGGGFHHEIGLQNINSDRSAGSLSVTTAGGAVSNFGFHAPSYFLEQYETSDWSPTSLGATVTWSATPFATNQNANALRWSTLYSYWLDSEQPIQTVTIGLFKPGTPASLPPIAISPPAPLAARLAALAAAPGPQEGGSWLVAPESVELRLGGKADSTFRVFPAQGEKKPLAKVASSFPGLNVSQAPVREGNLSGYEIRVNRNPDASPGYFETVLTLESGVQGDPPHQIRVFGQIVGDSSK
jgi:hypothetical protein